MRTIKLLMAYDGTRYLGWQVQPTGPTVQEELAKAIESTTGVRAMPTASGRTDAGVHALGQIAVFTTASRLAPDVLVRALNANLPDDIRVHEAFDVEPGFDPIRAAKWKTYRYVFHDGKHVDVFLRRYCWKVHHVLDPTRMREAAVYLEGTHDFRSFETEWPNRASSVRTVRRCQPVRLGDLVYLDVEADGFLYNMVRAIAGTLYEVGRGKWSPELVKQILDAGDRRLAGRNAPPQGLFLVQVVY
jgi:tRNA pseudouridine38-40 synthase